MNNSTLKNSISLLKNSPEFINLNCDLIDRSQKFIFFHTYIFEDDDITAPIIDSLCKASKERGVQVFFLLDAFGSPALSKKTLNALQTSQIYFSYFTPILHFGHIGRRLHQKILIIDNQFLILGGINYGRSFNTPLEQLPWLDYACLCEGEIVQKTYEQIHHIYLLRFPEKKIELMSCLKIQKIVQNETAIKINVNDWMRYKQNIYRSYLRAIMNAQSEIIILATYFIPSKKMLRTLKKAAARGVNIHLIFSSKSDHPLVDLACDYYYQWYLNHGIHIYEWGHSVIHGKVAVIDEYWSTVGSYNHNYTSQYGNLEANLEIEDRKFAKVVRNELQSIIHSSVRIDTAALNVTILNRIKVSLVYFLTNIIIFLSILLIYKRKK